MDRIHVSDLSLNVGGNILLFIPLGAALRLSGTRLRSTLLIALVVSALVETTQLLVPGRTTSADDVLLNTLGALIGSMAVRSRRFHSL